MKIRTGGKKMKIRTVGKSKFYTPETPEEVEELREMVKEGKASAKVSFGDYHEKDEEKR